MDNLVPQSGKTSAYALALSAAGLKQDLSAEEALETRNVQVGSFGKIGKEVLQDEEVSPLSSVKDQLTQPIETEMTREGLKIDKFEDGRTRAESPDGVVREENPDGSVFISIPGGWLIHRDPDGNTAAVNQYTDESYPVTTLTEAGPDGPREVYEFTANGEKHRLDPRKLLYQGPRSPNSLEEREKLIEDLYFRENPELEPFRGRPRGPETDMDGVLSSLIPLPQYKTLWYMTEDEKKAKLAELAPDLSQLVSSRPDITPGQAFAMSYMGGSQFKTWSALLMSRKDITVQDVFLATKSLNSRIGDTSARGAAASSVADILQRRPDLSPTEAVELIMEEGKKPA